MGSVEYRKEDSRKGLDLLPTYRHVGGLALFAVLETTHAVEDFLRSR